MSEQRAVAKRLTEALGARPFRPFQLHLCDGKIWTIDEPQRAMVTKDRVYAANGEAGALGYENVCNVGIEWFDRIEFLPTVTTTAPSQAPSDD